MDEAEIRDRFGPLIYDAIQAFTEDPQYLIDMMESCAQEDYKAAYKKAKAAAYAEGTARGLAYRARIVELLTEWGVEIPKTSTLRNTRLRV